MDSGEPPLAPERIVCLLSALTGDHPVVCLEHRWSYGQTGEVPEGWHPVPIGRARVAREGTHLTFVAASQLVHECLRAAEVLARDGVEAEVIDLRSVRPWDVELVCERVRRTGRLVIADTGWTTFGISAEIAARVGEELVGRLRAAGRPVGLPSGRPRGRHCSARALGAAAQRP